MNKDELEQARTNPDFLKYLEESTSKSIEEKNIDLMYETLDSMLILDLDEEKINFLYEEILKLAFENVEKIVQENRKLNLTDEYNLNYVRAFYEHGIEKWSYDNFDGAKELFFVLSNIVEDDKLCEALKVLIVSTSKKNSLDDFYEKQVDFSQSSEDEIYGYFMIDFKFDKNIFLEENKDILETEYKKLNHLLEV